jgi:hypothetical protein
MADELVPTPAPTQAVATQMDLPDWLGLSKHMSLSTFDTATQDGLRMLTKMSAGCDMELGMCVGKELDISAFYMTPYERLDTSSGEMQQLVFIGLVDSVGRTYSTSSVGVRKSLLLLARQFGLKQWSPPVRVLVRSVKLSVGQMYTLEFISRAAEPAKQKGK